MRVMSKVFLVLGLIGACTIPVAVASIPHERLVGLFEDSALLKRESRVSNEAFFDRLGQQAPLSDPFSKIRKIEKLDVAKRYLKASRGGIHAYAIQFDPPVSDTVYFVVDGDMTVYALSGSVTPEMYENILANMRVAPIP